MFPINFRGATAVLLAVALCASMAQDFSRAADPAAKAGEKPAVENWKKGWENKYQSDDLHALSIDPQGQRLAYTVGGTVKVLDLASGKERLTLKSPMRAGPFFDSSAEGLGANATPIIRHLEFSPDGKMLATDGGTRAVELWDLEKGKLRFRLGSMPGVLAFSPDGKQLATNGPWAANRGAQVMLWDVATGRSSTSFVVPESDPGTIVMGLAYAPNGKALAVQTKLAFKPDPAVLQGAKPLVSIPYSPDGKPLPPAKVNLAFEADPQQTAREKRMVTIIDLATRKPSWQRKVDCRDMRFADNKRLLLYTFEWGRQPGELRAKVEVWDVETRKEICTMTVPNIMGIGLGDKNQFSLHPDGRTLATISDVNGKVSIWNAETGKLMKTISVLVDPMPCHAAVLFSPDGQMMFTSCSTFGSYWGGKPPPWLRAELKQWRVETGSESSPSSNSTTAPPSP